MAPQCWQSTLGFGSFCTSCGPQRRGPHGRDHPENPGDGKLGGGIFPFTGPHGLSCIDRMEWSTGYLRGCGVPAGTRRAGGRGNAAKQQLTRWEWEGVEGAWEETHWPVVRRIRCPRPRGPPSSSTIALYVSTGLTPHGSLAEMGFCNNPWPVFATGMGNSVLTREAEDSLCSLRRTMHSHLPALATEASRQPPPIPS